MSSDSDDDDVCRNARQRNYRFRRQTKNVVLPDNSSPSSSASESHSSTSTEVGNAKRRRLDGGNESSGTQSDHSEANQESKSASEGDSNPEADHESVSSEILESGADDEDVNNRMSEAGSDSARSATHTPPPEGLLVGESSSSNDEDSGDSSSAEGEQYGSSSSTSEASSSSLDSSSEEDGEGGPQQEPLYHGARLCLGDLLMAIMTLAMTHAITGVCLADLLKLLEIALPQPNKCPKSLYKLKQFFSKIGRKTLIFHYFCGGCLSPLTSENAQCRECEEKAEISFFIEIPLFQQLQRLFSRPGFVDDLKYRFTRVKQHEGNIEDVFDGVLYQNEVREGFLSDPANISFMWYSDGVSIFKSSKFSIWPLCYVINELPYQKRVLKENIVLAGLWFGTVKPCVNLFLQPFLSSLNEFQANGFAFDVPGRLDPLRVRGKLLCGTCDLQAKSTFLRTKASNGYYGCLKCLSKGEREAVGRTTVHVHPYNPNNMIVRTNEEVKVFSRIAVQSKGSCYGIKGPSLMYDMMVNMIVGTGIDVMHGIFIGVFKLLMSLWFGEKHSGQPFSLFTLRHVVDTRLKEIRPPSFVQRMPRSIDNYIKLWKASEYKLFFFYYGIPLLQGLWDSERYFHHYLKLVSATYLLSQRSIFPEQLVAAGNLYQEFVRDMDVLYGRRYLGINVHNLLHLEQCVRDLGNVWCYSCFFLEDLNGGLARLVHGTRHAGIQICSSATLYMSLSTMINKLDPQSVMRRYCEKVRGRNAGRLKVAEEISCVLKVLGKYDLQHNQDDIVILSNRFHLNGGCFQYFNRILFHGKSICSLQMPRVMKTSSVHVSVLVDQVPLLGRILKFVRWSGCLCNQICLCVPARYFAIIQVYNRVPYFVNNVPNIRLIYLAKVVLSDRIICIDITNELKCLCFHITVGLDEFIATPVNLLEIE